MVNISSQTTRTSGRAQNYAKKDAVAISALNASVPLFEKRLQEIRARHGKDGMQPRALVDEDGKVVRDAAGNPVRVTDANGRPVYESTHVQAYCLVQSFGHDELDPDDPESWTTANKLGRALAEDRFPGYPALIATEINGRSGCVHNHLIIGAVNPETGKSIDSNVVTHARLAIAHDRVLEANGFTQRADMAQKTQAAEQAMAAARDAALADPATAALSPSEQQRRITAAENAVRLHRDTSASAAQARENRRLRELDRYQLTERDRMIAADIGVAPPAERFSEIELEARVKDALSDPRFRSWDELAEVAHEHRVTIIARGQDVSFGMMLAQPDGTLADPARAHVRRGGRPGTGKGLGDGFRREDIEAAIERNMREHEEAEKNEFRPVETNLWADLPDQQRRLDELSAKQSARVEELQAASDNAWASATGETQPESEPAPATAEPRTEPSVQRRFVSPAPAFRSELRDLRATTPPLRERLDRVGGFEEHWRGRLPSTPEDRVDFERQATEIGIGSALLAHVDGHMDPELHARLTARAEQAEERQNAFNRSKALTGKIERLGPQGDANKLRAARADQQFETGYIERISADRALGIYDSRKHERIEHLTKRNATQVAELEGHEPAAEPRQEQSAKPLTATEQRLRDKQAKQRRDNQKESEPQSQRMQM